MDKATVRETVIQSLMKYTGESEQSLLTTDKLTNLNNFSSVKIMQIIEEIEEKTGKDLPPELFVPKSFESIENITTAFMDDVDYDELHT